MSGVWRAGWPGLAPWLGRGWLSALLVSVVVLLAGCATVVRPVPALPRVSALPPQPGGQLAEVEQALATRLAPGQSGFGLLQSNQDALRWRLAAVDAARHSLDLQYYVWFGDKAGQLLLARVVAAADRGVRVRLLFDDLSTLLHDMDHVQLRDAALARLASHPHIELRLFNAWRSRGLWGRAAETLWDFQRLNRRMHNKQMVVDNRLAILGGRNIGDEYFGLNPAFNFHDLDVLGVGPVARQASEVFDRYWNSPWVRDLGPLRDAQGSPEPSLADQQALAALEADARGRLVLAGQRHWEAEWSLLPSQLVAGRSTVHADSPSRDPDTRNHTPEAFRALLLSARREVLITNAYVIPDAAFIDDLRRLQQRGVQVRLLTNSLASHDVPAVNSHYERWRAALLAAGVQLHELRPDAALRAQWVDTPPVVSPFVGLHTKAMAIDGERVFVGSMNLDPRSELLNAEMGVVIDSPALAQALADGMRRDMGGRNSWQVLADAQGHLRWTSDDGSVDRQPARHLWQRVENLLFKLLPPRLY